MRRMSRWIPIIGGAIAGGIIALVIATNGHHTKTVTTTIVQTASGTAQPTSFSSSTGGKSINQIYEQDGPGVVDILVKSKTSGSSSGGIFGGSSGGYEEGEGAGVVYNSAGYILTDEHVIDNAVQVVVTFQDGRKVAAKVIGSDASSDVGVIKVNVPKSELHPIAFANSDSAQVGAPVVAIGSPFSLPETVTTGIVSQTGRVIQAPTTPKPYSIPDAIQTDAAINPGNSGGPLLNAAGDVLGLNDQIETDETNTSTGQGQNAGIGFATPANEDAKVANEIIAHKTVQHAYLGIEASGEEANTESLSTQNATGITVGPVTTGGPAAKAGVQKGDVIKRIGSTTITSFDELVSVLARDNPGQTVSLTVDRSGQTKQISVTLGNRPKATGSGG
jgi:putative serine protease PepD